MKKKIITYGAILAIVAGLIVFGILVANSNFDFVAFLIKLHGG
jgi:hypothetical protein